MNMTKRLLAVTVLLTMVLCLVACGGGEETKTPTGPTPTTTVPTTVPTTAPTTVPTQPDEEYTYRIRVVDEKGEPIEGAFVIFCLDQCSFYETNADGWALINAEVTDGYMAHIMSLPEGYENYTFIEEYIYFAPGQTEMVLSARPAE